MRILFASYYAYGDTTSGASLSMREMLLLLTQRGARCEVVCGPLQDSPRSLKEHFASQGAAPTSEQVSTRHGPYVRFRYRDGRIAVTLCSTAEPMIRGEAPPASQEQFLDVLDEALDRFRPDVMLTYGGQGIGQSIIHAARRRGIPVVFWLRNTAYTSRNAFENVQGIIVPSDFSRQHYKRTLDIDCTAIPPPVSRARAFVDEVDGKFVTFVNPVRSKGIAVIARILLELDRLAKKIPLLIVEGRGNANEMQSLPVDLRGLEAHVMKNTSDPRSFYAVSRMVLMPSLWRETYGRVAAEACMNGIPVLASSRGGLPENLGHGKGGFVFDIPDRYTPESKEIPTAEDVRPWVETIVRLWEDDAYHREWSQRARQHADTVTEEKLADRHEAYLRGVIERSRG